MSAVGLAEVLRVEETERVPLALVTMLSGALACACLVVGAVAVKYDFGVFDDPSRLLAMSHVDIASVRAFMLLDMFGYYLSLAPIIVVSHRLLASQTPWASVVALAGVAYVLIGAIGAAILAATWPSLLAAHAAADASSGAAIRASFMLITDVVYGGLWNVLEVLLAGVWWVGFGRALHGSQPKLAWLTVACGVFPLADAVASMLRLDTMHGVTLDLYLVTSVVWPVVIGVALIRDRGALAHRSRASR